MITNKEHAFLEWYFGLDLIPMLLVSLGGLVLVSGIMLLIFFKAPVRKGGVFGGLESIEDPEEREAMRRYVFGLDEERPLIGKEKQKAEAKAAKEKTKGKTETTAEPAEPIVIEKPARVSIMDAAYEVVSEEDDEEVEVTEEAAAEEIGEAVEEAVAETTDSEGTV